MDKNAIRRNTIKKYAIKVPQITLFFWIVKILSTTVGETAADFLNENMGFGLKGTTVAMGILLAVVIVVQLKLKNYIASSYWAVVIMMSIEGTLITDMLVETFGITLLTSTIVFTIAMIAVFITWYKKEGTLSIHSVDRFEREAFYWLVILIAFALGTAFGDMLSEKLALGYLNTLMLFTGSFALVALLYFAKVIGPVLGFWLAFILTRPVGASLGDFMIQARDVGGLAISVGTVNTLFFAIIMVLIFYLTYSKSDVLDKVQTQDIE